MKQKIQTLYMVARLCGIRAATRLFLAGLKRQRQISLPLPRQSGSVVCRLNNSDIVIFTAVFWGGEVKMPRKLQPQTILDLGANAGLTTVSFALQFPNAQILAVEPGSDNFLVCQQNVRQFANIVAVRRACSAEKGWLELVNPGSMAMSQKYAKCNELKTGAVETLTIVEALNLTRGSRPVLVKMDIEGAEIEIFRRCAEWIQSVDVILVEPHGSGTDALIKNALELNGFDVSQIGEKIFGMRRP